MIVESLSSAHNPAASLPRGSQREKAILEAAISMLMEVGYEEMTIDALAARAKASKATIYRHWSGKAEIVADALKSRACSYEAFPDTGSLRGDLSWYVRNIASQMTSQDGPLISGLMAAMQKDPDLCATIHSQVLSQKKEGSAALIDRSIERGELRQGTDARAIWEVAPAMIFMRHLILGQQLDETYLDHLVDEILIPLLQK